MDRLIINLATKVYDKQYASLLAEDLPDYSDKEKMEALQSLREQAVQTSLSVSERVWLTSNTCC